MAQRATAILLSSFARHTSGATAIEYAIMAGGIALAVTGVVFAIGPSLEAMFQSVADGF